jgi:hypothetical protein
MSASGSIPSCGQTSLSSSPDRWTMSVPAFGLTQRLAAGDDDQRALSLGPQGCDPAGQRLGAVPAAIFAVQADEIGIAKAALGVGAVFLAAGPQIAAGEAQKDGAAAGLHPLALQSEEDFLDRVAHRTLPAEGGLAAYWVGSARPASAKPRLRRRQLSHRPQWRPSGAGS